MEIKILDTILIRQITDHLVQQMDYKRCAIAAST